MNRRTFLATLGIGAAALVVPKYWALDQTMLTPKTWTARGSWDFDRMHWGAFEPGDIVRIDDIETATKGVYREVYIDTRSGTLYQFNNENPNGPYILSWTRPLDLS